MGIRRNKTWLLFPVEPNKWVRCQIKGTKRTRGRKKSCAPCGLFRGLATRLISAGIFMNFW